MLHRVLKTTKKGTQELEVVLLQQNQLSLVELMESALKKLEPIDEIYVVHNTAQFTSEFVKLEENHPQKRSTMKLGLIYCKKDQIYPKDMFQTPKEEIPECFWKFLSKMGREISLEPNSPNPHTGYRGDMGNVGSTYYEVWQKIEIVYHASPLMGAEGHRRLIGNDIAVMFFLEEGAQFDSTHVELLGTVPQLFAVIQPVGEKFRLGYFSNINIKQFTPPPTNQLLDFQSMKDHLLTKSKRLLYSTLIV
eukprot:TRINITY_DN132_c5_g1_i14.p1 TRINITY_DN132_c5_g1~~TRINITY_DN132_c5_g1_i14.p1  ORF type:complete len:249 (+),score=38.14 TRINITY_DN132_c5_g1_i14:408-1154(+)